jgi:hypothetical protein
LKAYFKTDLDIMIGLIVSRKTSYTSVQQEAKISAFFKRQVYDLDFLFRCSAKLGGGGSPQAVKPPTSAGSVRATSYKGLKEEISDIYITNISERF